jgi:phospholipid/cholesterol/gamma-HCH transport system substrate-binding protein
VARVAAAAALALAFLFLLYLLFFAGDGGHRYSLLFENGGQLVPDNQVLIGGTPVGNVDSIDLTEDNLAQVDVTVDQQLHEGSTAVIRATSLSGVANHYVSISPGPNSNPSIPDDGTLGTDATTTSVDVDQLFNTFPKGVRQGLSDFIRGYAETYAGRGKEANATYKYFYPALNRTTAWLRELNADQRSLSRFIVGSSDLFTGLASRSDDLSASIANANTAFASIASQNQALSETLRVLPQTFRQANTTFVNLRAALDDLDPLIATAKPATKDLAPFLRDLRPFVTRAIPFFKNLRYTFRKPGKANDFDSLVSTLPENLRRSRNAFPATVQSISDVQPFFSFARPYTPELLNGIAKLGQVTGYYDANGHYLRATPVMNLFSFDSGSGVLEPIPPSDNFDANGLSFSVKQRCPGGASQPAQDGSSPFVNPPHADAGVTTADCDTSDSPPNP